MIQLSYKILILLNYFIDMLFSCAYRPETKKEKPQMRFLFWRGVRIPPQWWTSRDLHPSLTHFVRAFYILIPPLT